MRRNGNPFRLMAGGITVWVVWPCAMPLRICRPYDTPCGAS